MEKSRRPWHVNRQDLALGGIVVLIVIADQLIKAWVKANIALNTVFYDAGFFQIIHTQNTGVSFGLFKGHIEIIIAVVFIEILVLLLVVYLLRNRLSFLNNMLMRTGIGLVLGGAIGNQIDRLVQGHVTDFFDFKVWPAFNIADAAAVVGTIIIAYCILFRSGLSRRRK